MKTSIKLRVFSDRLFERNHGEREVGFGGMHWGADGEGWGRATVGWGVGAIARGSTVGVSSTSKSRPSHHKYKSLKNSLSCNRAHRV